MSDEDKMEFINRNILNLKIFKYNTWNTLIISNAN